MSERLDPGFGAGVAPARRISRAGALLRSTPARLRYAISRDLDAKPEELIDAALRHARRTGRAPVCVAASFPLTPDEIDDLARQPGVNAIVSKHSPGETQSLNAEVPNANLGVFWEPGHWLLPDGATHVYFIGSWRLVTLAMLREAFRKQVVTLSARCGWEWIDIPLGPIGRVAAARRFAWRVLRKARTVQDGARQRLGRNRVGGAQRSATSLDIHPFDAGLVGNMIRAAREERSDGYVPGRVVLACGNLTPGGAERQAAYTARGIARAPGIESVRLLCDMLGPGHPARYDFYLPLLEGAGVEARVVDRSVLDRSMVEEPPALAAAQASFPEGFLLDVANLYREFVRLRPEIVHAWLDWSNTRAGLAAALAGVPRILLSGRNLNPTHFALYQPYMDPVYQALCGLPNVVLLNNSRAGAESYAAWLGMSPDRIAVVYNGLEGANRGGDQGRAIRMQHGIPADAPLIGGVFRFYPEKRPLLWLEAAAQIARSRKDAWFILFGQGVLRADIEKSARAFGIADRVLMPGVIDDVLPAMQAMDVFLLTSYGEGVPNVVLEAQSVGTPVVATQAGGVAEAVDPGVTGWVLDPADPAALAERICWVLAHPEERERARTAGPAFVRSRFGMQRMIDETLEAYGLV